ncbi:hypothetical protein VT50_0216400 [Streptomyces antioxidans]|uniref:Transmembrane protein n=1 Tax=Streptomyces antioxidans TaxID=1507734 RepID=A0A1V4D4M0_9ACTN|nr:membrane protein [Streptomyces antioxidans]OPF79267.1 hypothetical protein VT50_0216400 [Streptomyces antioxidans]
MKSAPHLLTEDRPEFERVLDDALRTAELRPDLSGIGQRLTTEQLRTMALGASAAIAACAADEYQTYRDTRAKLREPAPLFPLAGDVGERERPDGTVGLAGAMQGAAGAGLVAMLAVLAPVLAGTAAIIFLIVGYVLNVLDPAPSIAQPMVTAGWFFAALTAAGILIAAVGLLLTALRNGSSAIRGDARSERMEEVDRAREAWRDALLERGILPFLREALANPSAPSPSAYVPINPEAVSRTPHLGYTRPGFSTDGEGPKARPRYSSPDYTSPDYGGPEHQPD